MKRFNGLIGLGVTGLIALTLSACAPTPVVDEAVNEATKPIGPSTYGGTGHLDGGFVTYENVSTEVSAWLSVELIDPTSEEIGLINTLRGAVAANVEPLALPVPEWVLDPNFSVTTSPNIAQEYLSGVTLECTSAYCWDWYTECGTGTATLANALAIETTALDIFGMGAQIELGDTQKVTFNTPLPCAYMKVPLPEEEEETPTAADPPPPSPKDTGNNSTQPGQSTGIDFYEPLQSRG